MLKLQHEIKVAVSILFWEIKHVQKRLSRKYTFFRIAKNVGMCVSNLTAATNKSRHLNVKCQKP